MLPQLNDDKLQETDALCIFCRFKTA